MSERFSLLLFATAPDLVSRTVAAGIDGIIVDWEHIGKESRQAVADTQINHDTPEDLRRVRACTTARVICRINRYGPTTPHEIEQAIDAGADEILLPMVQEAEEVTAALKLARNRCDIGILVETVAAVEGAEDLAAPPLSRVYVGLNDLAIDRGTSNIFTPLVDGTLDRLRDAIRVPFGFGGLTVADRGYPIPCWLLIGEMVRLRCQFSFLRRSFHRDIQDRDVAVEVPRIREAIRSARLRSPQAIASDRAALVQAIEDWPPDVQFRRVRSQ